MARLTGSTPSRIGFALTRIVVPLWVLAGAVFKLYERTPANLPSGIRAVAKLNNLDLDLLMRMLIGLELFAVGVMLFVPRLARPMAIFMLTCFCGILIWEMVREATKCGCFGDLPIKPWQMLIVDGSLLIAVLIFGPSFIQPNINEMQPSGKARRSWTGVGLAAFACLIIGLGVAFAVPNPPGTQQTPVDSSNDPTVNPNPLEIPHSWTAKPSVESWVGKNWRDIDLFQLMPRWPKEMDAAKRYVVFYSRTCEHCEEMFSLYLIAPLDGPVAAVEIPASPTELTDPGAWLMPEIPAGQIEHLALPLGATWVITSPIVVALENGTITCANEGSEFLECLGLKD